MKPLDQQTIGQRIALTLVLVLAILFMLAFIGWISGGWDEAPAATTTLPPIDAKYEDQFIALDRKAIEEAYYEQIKHLFQVWAKDETSQPQRAVVGAKQARRMFISSMDAIANRERQLREQQR